MNTNIKIFLLCPVPEEQKPINTYIGLKENPLTSWTTLSKKNFEKKLFSFSFYFLAIVSLFSVGSLEDSNYFFEWFLKNTVITCAFLIFLLIIIFYRWKQVEKDFNQPRIFYEEASWYDGQIWEKPFSILKNDKLISTQKIKPILQRISRTIFILSSFFFSFLFLLEIE
jgi:hypothetical protein